MRRYILKITALLSALAFITSCDFEEKNIDPNNSPTIEPGPLLTYTQLNTSNEGLAKRTQVGYCMMMVQQTASLDLNEMAGDKYLETETLGIFFTTMYATVIKNIEELINLTEDEGTNVNTYAVALIWKSYLFHRITDLYGDVPYSEADTVHRTSIRAMTGKAIFTQGWSVILKRAFPYLMRQRSLSRVIFYMAVT